LTYLDTITPESVSICPITLVKGLIVRFPGTSRTPSTCNPDTMLRPYRLHGTMLWYQYMGNITPGKVYTCPIYTCYHGYNDTHIARQSGQGTSQPRPAIGEDTLVYIIHMPDSVQGLNGGGGVGKLIFLRGEYSTQLYGCKKILVDPPLLVSYKTHTDDPQGMNRGEPYLDPYLVSICPIESIVKP